MTLNANAQKLKKACAQFEGVKNCDEKKPSTIDANNEYSNKLRESCKKIYNTDSNVNSESSTSGSKEFLSKRTSSGLRHSKFLLAKLELQKLKESAIARKKAIEESESFESNDIDLGPFKIEASHKICCNSPRTQSCTDETQNSYPEKLEESWSDVKQKPKRIQPRSILKRNYSNSSEVKENTSRKSSKRKRITLDPLLVFWDCAREGDTIALIKISESIRNINEANSLGVTALHNAACIGNRECVEFLISKKCDVNCSDSKGWTALHYAAYTGFKDVCSCLIKNGANVFAKTYDSDETPIELCAKNLELNIHCYQFFKDIMPKMLSHNEKTVYATHNYRANYTDELSFTRGEELKVLTTNNAKDPEYWLVKNNARIQGLVPRVFLTVYRINMTAIS